MDQCPYCEKYIPSGLKVCPECGHKFSLAHRALDTYGGTIPPLFCAVRDFVNRVIPGKVGRVIGNVLGMTVVLLHVSLMLLLVLVLVIAANALLTGRLDSVDWFSEIAGAITGLFHFTLWFPAVARLLRREE